MKKRNVQFLVLFLLLAAFLCLFSGKRMKAEDGIKTEKDYENQIIDFIFKNGIIYFDKQRFRQFVCAILSLNKTRASKSASCAFIFMCK